MNQYESEQNNQMVKLLLLGVWVLYVLLVFLNNRAPDDRSAANVQEDSAPVTELAPESQPLVPRDIYLTFDDGPCANTLDVLDILDSYNAKATFFTVGFFVQRYPDYAAEIVNRGNVIACHSYTHDVNQCYASADAFMNEFTKSMVSLHPKTVSREFYSDYVTPLKYDIHVKGTIVHIIYALKMGKKYEKRYLQHFRDPDILRFDMQHEAWLFQKQWEQPVLDAIETCMKNDEDSR